MGFLGKLDRYRLNPGDTSTWRMGEDGTIQGDTAVTRERLPGYFQGGDGFSGRDALAGVLAAIGDAFAQRGGMQPIAMQGLMGQRSSIMDRAQEAQAAQLARAQGIEDYRTKKSIDREMDGPPAPPAMQRNYEWWKGLPPQEQANFARYQSVVNPDWIKGEDGVPRQMVGGGLPQGYDPNEWEVVDEGGGVGNGTGGFPPRYRR